MKMVHGVVLLLLSLAMPALAAAEIKIAVVDVQQAVADSAQAREEFQKIQEDLGATQTELRAMNSDLMARQERLVRDAEVLSESDRRRLAQELEDKQMEYQLRVSRFQRDLNERQQQVVELMMPKVNMVILEIIGEEGYQLILHRQTILFADNAVDITRRVTEMLNARR